VTVQSIQQIIFRLRDSGISILITDHAAMEILSTVDRCYVISKGVVLKEGTPEEVKQHPEVRKQYLGNLQDHPAVHTSEPANSLQTSAPQSFHAVPPEPALRRAELRRRSEPVSDGVE
jgi:lipopolysaccharide export system ATP-binding protein